MNQAAQGAERNAQAEIISPLGSSTVTIGDVVLTFTRTLYVTPYWDAGWNLTAYKVGAGAQTQSDKCIDSIYQYLRQKW